MTAKQPDSVRSKTRLGQPHLGEYGRVAANDVYGLTVNFAVVLVGHFDGNTIVLVATKC